MRKLEYIVYMMRGNKYEFLLHRKTKCLRIVMGLTTQKDVYSSFFLHGEDVKHRTHYNLPNQKKSEAKERPTKS